ncbi:hypothetical protein DFH29DRAFT_982330 [Suillus ampliporus]|nr:hypothetical protein DFH29DRAFT_982330 [Suillus ampliporus]
MDVDTMFPPPGEEGFSFSHGAEEVSFINAEGKKLAFLHNVTISRSSIVDHGPNSSLPSLNLNDPWVDEPDSGDSLELSTVCVDHWRNAAPESHKKMFTIFKRSGIFIAVCRHGFLLTICDMGVVPTFHGHAHNCLCQVEHHSKYKVNAGKEDFETYEFLYLKRLACKKDETSTEVDYVKALNKYEEAQASYEVASKDAGIICRHHTHAATNRDQKLEVVMDYKWQMTLDRVKAQSHTTHHLYHKAVDDVEHLATNCSTQILTALKSCENAICNALQRCNKYAAQLDPPHPLLQWEQIVEYSFLAEFNLL